MIDQDKMRALAARHREEAELAEYANRNTYAAFMRESADAIDLLLAEVEAAKEQSRKWQALTESSQQVAEMAQRRADKLRAELGAAAADKRDAERWRKLKSELHAQGRFGVYNDGWLDEQSIDAKIDAALAQRQGEGS
ncbi:hypothetical protein [Burkholderia cepacia]|uniref:hypothetical protein n=1 Tax=Burkholderia cepacia TaxID=292 RepID=UPI003D66DE32